MGGSSKIDSSEYTDLNRVIRWFIGLRWAAAVGVLAALVFGHVSIRYSFNFTVLYVLTGILVLMNSGFALYYGRIKRGNLSRKEMGIFFHVQICSDYVLLFLLIYFSGFLNNPFIFYFVFHIMLTAFIFPSRVVFYYVLALVLVFSLFMGIEYGTDFGLFFRGLAGLRPVEIPGQSVLFGLSLLTTLILTAYLVTRIKIRIVERGKKIEFELNRYKSLDKAKSNFILQVTHELRGPLAAVKGYHEMILKGITGNIAEKTGDTLKKATRRTKNLLTIIDEMIDYAYMKSEDEVHFTKIEIDMHDSIQNNIEYFENLAQERGIKLVFSCRKNIKVYANRDLLNIIISNLITNALRYSKPDSKVSVNGDEGGDEVHLLVRDEGIGIEEDELENIFEEFYRTRKAREIERDGTGLGLSIVKKAVDSLGGRLVVYSELDKGTSFHIYLPKT